jgi:succinoglycan biosynthesis protein ExoM
MTATPPNHISICVCTFRRPLLLERLLRKLADLRVSEAFEFSVVVADNDASESARDVVVAMAKDLPVKVTYCCEARQNIALARNRAIENAAGNFIAFIDDDEFPESDWLLRLFETCQAFNAAGVLGPVRPHFEQPPPAWITRGRFCERPEQPTGTVVPWQKSRTGNVLFRRDILSGEDAPFNEAFGTGGEDTDFFMRMNAKGQTFVWCNEAAAYETVPPSRWTRGYMVRRALLRGKNTLRIRTGRIEGVLKSILAVPAYATILPFTALMGQHCFMKYCIKLCDHLGRLLAVFGLNWISERQM